MVFSIPHPSLSPTLPPPTRVSCMGQANWWKNITAAASLVKRWLHMQGHFLATVHTLHSVMYTTVLYQWRQSHEKHFERLGSPVSLCAFLFYSCMMPKEYRSFETTVQLTRLGIKTIATSITNGKGAECKRNTNRELKEKKVKGAPGSGNRHTAESH